MTAIVCTGYGRSEVLQVSRMEKPAPMDNPLRIRVFAATVTSGDLRSRGADPLIARSNRDAPGGI